MLRQATCAIVQSRIRGGGGGDGREMVSLKWHRFLQKDFFNSRIAAFEQ